MIPFNKPHITGNEFKYMEEAVNSGKISGNGFFTKKCCDFFEKTYGFEKVLLTTSCTDALEMCAILIDCGPEDEIIVPSYTFVSSALAFVRQGAKVRFVDSEKCNPNMDVEKIESLITPKSKAIIVVHYAGIAVDMDKIMALATKYNLIVIEDAAQSIDSFYNDKPLGSIGHLAAFSFHETKNIISGEGGMLVINDYKFKERAEIILDKGTNRASFFRGEIDKYGWVDVGSSFLPSEIIAAFLWAQLENLNEIQNKRRAIWDAYHIKFKECKKITIPEIPSYASNNAHMFYIVFNSADERQRVIDFLRINNIHAVFHYQSLHNSKYYSEKHDGRVLCNSDKFSNCLLRLPLFYDLDLKSVELISNLVLSVL